LELDSLVFSRPRKVPLSVVMFEMVKECRCTAKSPFLICWVVELLRPWCWDWQDWCLVEACFNPENKINMLLRFKTTLTNWLTN
jgi:hypothetical protein